MAKARFISRFGAPSVGVRHQITEHYATGKSKVIQKRLEANFHNHLVTDSDFAVALATFEFPGLPEDYDSNTNISPRYRVSVWDSEWARANEGFSDEEIDTIVEALRHDSGFGVDFIELAPVLVPAPFPLYDEIDDVDKIVAIVNGAGLDVEAVIAYELENKNRAPVVNALRGVEADDDVVVVQA